MLQSVVSPELHVELIVALLEQQLYVFELSAMNQMEGALYDGIALKQMRQGELV